MKTQVISEELVESVASSWGRFKVIDEARTEHGLDFGKACYELRESCKAVGQRKKDEGFSKILEDIEVPRATAYKWIDRYESVCLRIDKPNVHFASESDEWYTPPEIVARVVSVLESIDLDPCCNLGSPAIPAKKFLRKQQDGLAHTWRGRIYMNPPYGDAIGEWAGKLTTEYGRGNVSEAIALIPARPDTEWFDMFHEFAMCFIHGRLKFSNCENSAPFPSAIVYLGKNKESFYSAFEDIGRIRVPREWLKG